MPAADSDLAFASHNQIGEANFSNCSSFQEQGPWLCVLPHGAGPKLLPHGWGPDLKLFECQNCGQTLFFENMYCERCHLNVGYLPQFETMTAVKPEGATWIALANPDRRYRFCANWERQVCNWLVEAGAADPYCRACQHNRTVPDLSDSANWSRWQRIEEAKRRLIYTLLKLKLPLPTRASGDPERLLFDFLASAPQSKILTGHDNGIITISLQEADDVERERLRTHLHEPYRTLLGHFRHEVGHYYWDRLVRDGGKIEEFRAVFGDETLDYNTALQSHYQNGAPCNWRESYISAYATMHPWEDFAETWAHYLHMIDTLEMAYYFELRVSPRLSSREGTQRGGRSRPLYDRRYGHPFKRVAAGYFRRKQPQSEHGTA